MEHKLVISGRKSRNHHYIRLAADRYGGPAQAESHRVWGLIIWARRLS